ncbi:MAG: hypothetical protein WCD03_02970 [Candidatus Cybelea sp.]
MTKLIQSLAAGALALAACSHPQHALRPAQRAVQPAGPEIPSADVIRSQTQLNTNLRLTPKNASPLRYLTPDARERFLASLRFNERGVTTFRYAELQAELSARQIREVLALFGLQRDTSMIALKL